jgi:hypothetical protein
MNQIQEYQIQVLPGGITFPEYENLLQEAKQIAEAIDQMEVTKENIKSTKKTLATVNKAVKRLNDERIRVKKLVLAPYEAFAEQVKEIETIVKTADERVRQQVRDMEEAEREGKKEALCEIYEKRIQLYDFARIMTFDDWLEPQHLNKTVTLTKAEKDMTDWLEKVERDIATLSKMQHPEELIRTYKDTQDMALTMQIVEAVVREREEQKAVVQEVTGKEEYLIKVFSKKDLKLAEMLLSENEIEFETL